MLMKIDNQFKITIMDSGESLRDEQVLRIDKQHREQKQLNIN